MTIRKRLERLEADHIGSDDAREPVLLSLAGKSDVDVIGLGTSRDNTIRREPGETLDALVTRARPLLAAPWVSGLPIILMCAYADEGDGE